MVSKVDTIPALCIRQPWSHCILHLGKDIENRTWGTHYRGPMLVLASKKQRKSYFLHAMDWIKANIKGGGRLPRDDALPRGGIVGLVDVVGCVTDDDHPQSPWYEGPVGIKLANRPGHRGGKPEPRRPNPFGKGPAMDIDRQRIAAVRKLKELGFTFVGGQWVPAVAVGAPPPQIEADALHAVLVRRADAVAGCTEASEEEAELRADR